MFRCKVCCERFENLQRVTALEIVGCNAWPVVAGMFDREMVGNVHCNAVKEMCVWMHHRLCLEMYCIVLQEMCQEDIPFQEDLQCSVGHSFQDVMGSVLPCLDCVFQILNEQECQSEVDSACPHIQSEQG